jgi:hypothetical protein
MPHHLHCIQPSEKPGPSCPRRLQIASSLRLIMTSFPAASQCHPAARCDHVRLHSRRRADSAPPKPTPDRTAPQHSELGNYRFDVDRPHIRHLGQDRVKRTGLHRVVQGNRNDMDRRTIVSHPDVTALLPNHAITQTFQRADQTISRYVPRQFHAAWTGINSSFT